MPKQECPECGELVQMRVTPQSGRDYCPECDKIQEPWPERKNELMPG
jgi:ssDNA-binding Zn-finger/Zn-ribbon topoisomerase 1